MRDIILKNIGSTRGRVDVHIANGKLYRIYSAGETDFSSVDAEVVDGTGKYVLPSFINMHTHSGMTPMRGLGEDVDFAEWILSIWEVEKNIDPEYIYWATKLACLEMIKTGTTTFVDQYWHIDSAVKACEEMGIRPMLSYVFLDGGDDEKAIKQREECIALYEKSLKWPELAKLMVTIHAIYTVSESNILWAKDFANKHNLLLHIHVSETEKENIECYQKHGMSPVAYLDKLGILDETVVAAHTLWLSDDDIKILGSRGVTCVHNINSNLKLASGYKFRYTELKEAGANICIGTDGCASSNNLDILETMKTSAIVQKAWRNDPKVMPLQELMDMATINGAKYLGLDLGKFEEGALADLMIVDTDSTFFVSAAPFLADFIYSAHSDSIDSLICNGRFVMKNRVVEGEKEIIAKAREQLNKLKQ